MKPTLKHGRKKTPAAHKRYGQKRERDMKKFMQNVEKYDII